MNSRRNNSTLTQPSRSVRGGVTAAALLLIPVVVVVGGDGFREFLNFGAGVLSLVSLTLSVLWGLVATDRVFLNTRQRLIAQAVHRSTAVASVGFLLLHVSVKLVLDHTSAIAVVIPFGLGVTGTDGLIGFGTLAGLLMVVTALTGALRSAFSSPVQVAGRWRALHMLAYPAWCSALIHGLFAGREAKPVFVILYSLALVAVMGALLLRSAPLPFKRKVARRVLSLLDSDNRPYREEPGARRAGDSSLPGGGGRPGFPDMPVPSQRTSSPSGSYASPQRSALQDSASFTDTGGFAAAYRAVNTPRAQDPLTPDPSRMQVPMDMQATEAMPRVDDNTGPRWPAPSPPLYEAPPRPAGTPTYDTGTIPTYDANNMYDTGAVPTYGSSDVYDTGETNDPLGTYNANDMYNSGPATETQPGSYEAPSNGEPWNAPSGGF
ncbi:ferric reductase-like transmembrane domain-containing protein [Streptomyces sp. ActVer]|uniref:ferric reductase-like transmembrane domain-containing protein n=1 Tax=Streptomyces sp. ActVer TaxID=3014558 RepID=UPI0022B3CFEE|nr:ferric reductase-like transmembrane domain-containing protein [Streptomyces sp. ActVer]MCZ4508652.1 ferric reductase-like transmembrane domain-containing protein [Streptomyces sp. ActVer]